MIDPERTTSILIEDITTILIRTNLEMITDMATITTTIMDQEGKTTIATRIELLTITINTTMIRQAVRKTRTNKETTKETPMKPI